MFQPSKLVQDFFHLQYLFRGAPLRHLGIPDAGSISRPLAAVKPGKSYAESTSRWCGQTSELEIDIYVHKHCTDTFVEIYISVLVDLIRYCFFSTARPEKSIALAERISWPQGPRSISQQRVLFWVDI